MNHRRRMVLTVAVAALVSPVAPTVADAAPRASYDWGAVSVGSAVARGARDASGRCTYPRITVSTELPAQRLVSRGLAFQSDSSCVLRVADKWEDAVRPEAALRPTAGVAATTSGTARDVPLSHACNAGFSRKSFLLRVYSYGGGGPVHDQLTRNEMTFTYCYNGSTASVWHDPGSCWWHASTGWRNSACEWTGWNSSGWDAWSSNHAHYYWTVPTCTNCYNHDFYLKPHGYGNGGANCEWSWSGSVVFGPNYDCYWV